VRDLTVLAVMTVLSIYPPSTHTMCNIYKNEIEIDLSNCIFKDFMCVRGYLPFKKLQGLQEPSASCI